MSRIARAASARQLSRTIASSCGRRVWSMISTACPSAASQIVRIARPATFIAASPLEDPTGDRVEPPEEGGGAGGGGGDRPAFEGGGAALRALAGMPRQP